MHGRSLGGAVALYALNEMKEHKVRGLILENTFTSISDVVDNIFPFLSLFKNMILRINWRSIDRIEKSNQLFFFKFLV